MDSRTGSRVVLLLIAVLAISSLFITPVAADEDNRGENIICGGNEQVEVIFRSMIALFMIMGFTFGILMWAAEKFEMSVLGGEYKVLGGLSGEGKDALKSGVLLPVAVYFFDLIDVMLFGIEITCIVPKP